MRFIFLLTGGLGAVFGGWEMGLTGGGSLAAMTMGAIAAYHWKDATTSVAQTMGRAWIAVQPLLFGLIGAAVLLSSIETAYIKNGLIILLAGLIVRLSVSYLSVQGAQLNRQERLFIALAWLPKATVQAAIGALALDLARQYQPGSQAEIYGIQVLTLAVLSIICTAPLGALAIAWSGPRWLQQQKDSP